MPPEPEPGTLEVVTRSRSLPIAFLVYGDNAAAGLVGEMLAEAAKYGSVEIRRIYGDWATGKLSSCRPTVLEHALVPVQQFAAVSGKNSTDSALVIDAIDILHGGRILGFCIVSSDSDSTRLAIRLREGGMFFMGIGRTQTPPAFRSACHVFVATENLFGGPPPTAKAAGSSKAVAHAVAGPPRAPIAEAFEPVDKAFDSVVREDGSANLAELGNALLKLNPAFDSRTYGMNKLGDLLEAIPGKYELQRPSPRTSGAVLVRRRPSSRG